MLESGMESFAKKSLAKYRNRTNNEEVERKIQGYCRRDEEERWGMGIDW